MSTFLSQIAKITDHLYLSSFVGATEHNIRKFNITCIITVCKEVPKFEHKYVESLRLDVLDKPTESLARYFDLVADKINEIANKKGACLVHCVAGISRSATMILAYLMKYQSMNLRDAHALVKSRRPFIRPNLGFWRQLVEYENSLFGKTSVKIVPSSIGFIPDIYENEVKSMQWAKTNPVSAGTLAAANANMETNLNFVGNPNDNLPNTKPRGAIFIGGNEKSTSNGAHMSNINLNNNVVLTNMSQHPNMNHGKRLVNGNHAYYVTNGHGRVGQVGHIHGHVNNGHTNQYNNYNAHPHQNGHGPRRNPSNHNNYFNGVSNHSSNGHGESSGSNGGNNLNLNSLNLIDGGNSSGGTSSTRETTMNNSSSKDLPRRNSKYEPIVVNAVPKFSTSVPNNINILTINNAANNNMSNGENNLFYSNNPKNYTKTSMSLQPQHSVSMGQPAEIIIGSKLGKPLYTTTYRSSYQKPV